MVAQLHEAIRLPWYSDGYPGLGRTITNTRTSDGTGPIGPRPQASRRWPTGDWENLKWVAERDTPEGKEYVLHPADIEKVLLVVRKMVRGLCHYHGLTTQVADHQVLAMQYEHSTPPGAAAVEFNHVPGVFRYSYFHQHLEPDTIHVSWLLTFYDRISFIGFVSARRIIPRLGEKLKATTGDVPGPGRARKSKR